MESNKVNEMPFDQWMNEAKEFACRHFEYNLNDDHEFWNVLKQYWNKNLPPGEAVQSAIIAFGREEGKNN